MERTNIAREIASLPPEAQNQLIDFMDFLKTRYSHATQTTKKTRQTKLIDEPFIGMWQARKDMQDSSDWVRGIRQSEWKRGA